MRGPNVTAGYWNDPRRTESVLDSLGWFHTGDLGELTPAGLKLMCRADGLFKLNNGEKVPSLAVENCLTLTSHWIQNAVAVGAGESFVGALLFPNFRALRDWAFRCGRVMDSPEAFARDQEVQHLLRAEIARHAADLPQKYLTVKAAAVIPAELTLEAGQLTPSMKVVRHKVMEDFAPWVDALYHPDRNLPLRPFITSLKEA